MATTITTNPTDLATFQEYDAIKKNLHFYIDSAGPSNGAAMSPAFFDHARVVGAAKVEFLNWGGHRSRTSLFSTGTMACGSSAAKYTTLTRRVED